MGNSVYDIIINLLAASVTAGTPILFASLGELLTEKAGILNLGVEGMMLVGAVSGFIGVTATGNMWIGLLFGIIGGGLTALIHSILTVNFKANQVVSGLALTIFGAGLSSTLGKSYVGMTAAQKFSKCPIPILKDIPVVGSIVFSQNILVYISFALVPLLWFYINKTNWGLKLRSVGENPGAADAAGINVFFIKHVHVISGGMLAGLAGAYLSLAYNPSWQDNMTAGIGWIAVALVIFAMWDPAKAMVGSYIFGGLTVLGFQLQANGITIPTYFFKALPYILTIVVLIIVTRNAKKNHQGAPESLSIPYDREER